MANMMFFEGLKLSWLFFIILFMIGVFVLAAAGGYMLWNYHFGKPMAPFFWLRIAGWMNSKVALFEIFSLTNSVSLEEARKEVGDGYRLYIPSTVDIPVKKVGFWKKIYNYLLAKNIGNSDYAVKKVSRIQNLIMPKSTYSINGVNTIPLWDLHPQLHTDVLEGVKVLISQGIKTLEQFTEFISEKDNVEQILFKNYSYRTFYDLYMGVRQKYNMTVTTDDVANFIGKQFDKNFRESIEAKDFNAMQKSKAEGKFIVYGYLAIILAIIIIGIKILYPIIFK